ncbi:Nudix family hydrolase [Salinisphaera sp. T31B1]|uniref:Nudix family hydrolase n=1 Tax=Salinisphaera sp. T31B1 TaxID=727963 RepID=UPI00333FA741
MTAADGMVDDRTAGQQPLDIAVGVLIGRDGRLLIAQRREGTPGAGCWEFPGGKHEPPEAMHDCLARELAEEIGVENLQARPVIRFSHAHGERPVRLHVWRIDHWSGEPTGREGQTLRWVERKALADYELLPATDAIIKALFLPARYAITPSRAAADPGQWFAALERCLAGGIRLLRLRDQGLDDTAYAALATDVIVAARAYGAVVLLDRDAEMCRAVGADGLHWPVGRLLEAGARPLGREHLVAVSAHTSFDLAAAVRLEADFAVLSPVAATPTHPGAPGMGWEAWRVARGDHALPVYALGGLDEADLDTAIEQGAQGVAAIRAFWR